MLIYIIQEERQLTCASDSGLRLHKKLPPIENLALDNVFYFEYRTNKSVQIKKIDSDNGFHLIAHEQFDIN